MRRALIMLALAASATAAFRLALTRVHSDERAGGVADSANAVAELTQISGSEGSRGPSRESILRWIADSDNYLPFMLAESDSILRRWPARDSEPVAVYFEESPVKGYTPAKGRAVRDAFARWQRVPGIPVIFRYVRDSSEADVRVRWIKAFPMERAGQADVTWRSDGLILRATLTLATHSHTGYLLPREGLFTVALHEIGHLLGLGHSDEPRDVMYPSTAVQDLTLRDKQTAMLLYSLPPGSLKGG